MVIRTKKGSFILELVLTQPNTKLSVINSTFHLAKYENKSQLLINDENGKIILSRYMFIILSSLAGRHIFLFLHKWETS